MKKLAMVRVWVAALIVLLMSQSGIAADEAYPGSKPIRIVVPYPAGGYADSISRLVSAELARRLGGIFIVENRSGATGMIGAEAVAKSAPDGRTLLVTVTSQLSNGVFNIKPNYDPIADFAPIAGLSLAPMSLAVPIDMPADSIAELETLARTRPLAYGSFGVGTAVHVMLATFNHRIGGQMVHVPYRGESPLVVDLLGGRLQLALLTGGMARELAQAGKVKLLATVGPSRNPFLPQVPTFGELGYSGFDWTFGMALYSPAGVPTLIQRRLEQASLDMVASEEFRERLQALGTEPWGAPAAEVRRRLVIDNTLWKRMLDQFGKLE